MPSKSNAVQPPSFPISCVPPSKSNPLSGVQNPHPPPLFPGPIDLVKIKATFRLVPGNPYYKLEQLHMLWSNKLHKKWVYDIEISCISCKINTKTPWVAWSTFISFYKKNSGNLILYVGKIHLSLNLAHYSSRKNSGSSWMNYQLDEQTVLLLNSVVINQETEQSIW